MVRNLGDYIRSCIFLNHAFESDKGHSKFQSSGKRPITFKGGWLEACFYYFFSKFLFFEARLLLYLTITLLIKAVPPPLVSISTSLNDGPLPGIKD